MQRLNLYTEQGGVTLTTGGISSSTKVMGVFPGATCSVFNQGTLVLSTIYSDNGITPKSNPFTSDSITGLGFFLAANGHYDLQFSGTGFSTFTLADIILNDPADANTLGSLTVTGNATVGGTLGVTGNTTLTGTLSVKGGSPWFDVTTFGAKCDGATDDTAAIQAAWNAAKAVGSPAFVYIPARSSACIVAGTLNFSSSNGIRFGGLGGGTSTLSFPRITFTGTAAPLVNCQSSLALTFQHMAFVYNNAAFVGSVFDCTSAGTSNTVIWDNVMIGGTSAAKTAANLILAPGCQKCGAYRSHFGWGINGINSLGGNVFTVEDCDFSSAAGTLSGTYLINMTAGSRITGNNFEFINAPNTASIFDSSSAGCFGCDFSGNWSGDMPAGWTGTLLKGATGGMDIHGNTFQGVATGTVLTINGGQNGMSFHGNSLQGPWGTIFTANAAVSNVDIGGNQYSGAITNFWTGAGNIPSSGIVTDNSGNTTIYGGNLTMSAATFPRLILNVQGGGVDSKNYDLLATSTQLIIRHINDALNSSANAIIVDNTANVVNDVNLVPPVDFTEQAAPAGRAAFARLYADSTSHTLKASYNNAAFLSLPQVVASGTSTLTVNAALGAVTSQTAITTAATGALTTDAIEWSYASAPTAGDSLCHVSPYVTAGNVNFVRTNPTAAAQSVSAIVINWRIIR